MQAASEGPRAERGFQTLGVAIFLVVFGAVPAAILGVIGAPAWCLPLPLVAGFACLLVIGRRAAAQPNVAGFQRAAEGLLIREGESGEAPRWVEVPDERVYGFVVEKRARHDAIAVFYEESEERPVAQRFAPVEDDENELAKWLSEKYRRLDAGSLTEAENQRRVTERARGRGWQKDVMALPEDLRARLRRTSETLLQLPVHSEVRYHTELIDQYLPQLGNLLALLRKWAAVKNPTPKPPPGEAEDTLVLETLLAAARVISRIRDQDEPPDARYHKWDVHFRPICLAIAQAAGSQASSTAEPPIILGPPPAEKPVAIPFPSAPPGSSKPAAHGDVTPRPKKVPTDFFATPPEGGAAIPLSPGEATGSETVIEHSRPTLEHVRPSAQADESWPKPVREFAGEIQAVPWLTAKQIPPEARGLVVEHLRRLQPFRGESSSYVEALAAAKKASLDLREWAGWDPSEDDLWWIQFHEVRKQLDSRFGEAKAGQLYGRLKEICELHLLWESAHPPPAEPNPWGPVLQIYRLGLTLSFESVEPFGTVLEVPMPDPGKARNLEVVLPKG